MKKLFILSFFVFICTIISAQQKEYYVAGLDFCKGDTLKFGMDKNTVMSIVLKKMTRKDMFNPIGDTIIFANVFLDNVKYDFVKCCFGDNKLYKVDMKTYINSDYVKKYYPNLFYNPEIQKKLINDGYLIQEQIYCDSKSKYNK
jgi:hypothetical protein